MDQRTWAWNLDLPARDKLVLLALVDTADITAIASPPLAELEERCGMARRTVQRCLADLVDGRVIQIRRAATPRRPTEYRLRCPHVTWELDPPTIARVPRPALDLFAGMGGWALGARARRIPTIGLELDHDAALTRHRAGHPTIRIDVRTVEPALFVGARGLIASPPCQDFSAAGKRRGIASLRGQLVFEVLRFAQAIGPPWIACENVPEILPIWERFALQLDLWGYNCWTGILDAADFGVPQHRRRAFLLASLERVPTTPTSTLPPMSWGEALEAEELLESASGWRLQTGRDWQGDREHSQAIDADRSAPALTGQAVSWHLKNEKEDRTLTAPEGLVLQGFPPDYPVTGSITAALRQIGDAVPPPLAAAVLRAVA